MNIVESTVWAEKYRPQKISETILPIRLKDAFQAMATKKRVPPLLLHGGPGCGKTTVARAMLNELGADCMQINASLERGIDVTRNKIEQYASTISFLGGKKYVILDEADGITPENQRALRGFIDQFEKNCGFILTCNFAHRLIEPFHSRCTVIDFTFDKNEKAELISQFYTRVEHILRVEGVQYDPNVVAHILVGKFPDWRRALNELQHAALYGKVDTDALARLTHNIGEIPTYLKNQDFTSILKWVAENAHMGRAGFYKALYDTLPSMLTKSAAAQAVLFLHKYEYEAGLNPEINMTACLGHLSLILKGEWL
jgi:DNA polymerase III delta prime subunit